MERDNRSQEELGKKKRYTPPQFTHLTPEQESDAGRKRLA
jgi:hypothetical protein